MGKRKSLAGHFWTIAPTLTGALVPPKPPRGEAFEVRILDPLVGQVHATGRIRHRDTDTLVILVHGLGGDSGSIYIREAACAVEEAGFACLRFELRGATGDGTDIYNGGLSEDLHAALTAPAVKRYEQIFVIGFSLGGHVALKAATERLPARVAGVVAICSPLDLGLASAAIDAPHRYVYREYILRKLREMYFEVVKAGRNITPWERVKMVQSLREYDALTVVPRFGFNDVDDYYTTQSVVGRLPDLATPALYLPSLHDPMIPASVVEEAAAAAPEMLDVRWIDAGGHVYFPPQLDLGLGPQKGIVGQALGWLRRN